MAIGKASDFKIYDDFFIDAFTETVAQNLDAFNENSAGALVLRSEMRKGDYFKRSFYKEISSLDVRRDTTSTSSVAPAAMTQGEDVSVKLNRRQGPVEQNIDAFRKQGDTPERMSVVLGEQSAQALLQAYLHRALRAAVAAVNGEGALKHGATDGDIAFTDINNGMSKYEDNFGAARAIVMHSKPFFDLVGDGISNYKIDTVAGAIIASDGPMVQALGLPLVVTKDSALVNTDGITSGIDSYYSLILQEGGASVEESEVQTLHTWVGEKLENLTVGWQFEYAFNLGVKGFAWDVSNGGANPTDATISTGSNWDKVATDNRNLAGAIIESQ